MKAVSGKEMCRIPERKGWVCTRIRGSHHRFEKPDRSPVVGAGRGTKSQKNGTQREIMKQAGLTEADL